MWNDLTDLRPLCDCFRSFPIIFHNCQGKDEREGCSPSWFNIMEAKLVWQYAEWIREIRRNRCGVDP